MPQCDVKEHPDSVFIACGVGMVAPTNTPCYGKHYYTCLVVSNLTVLTTDFVDSYLTAL